MCGDGEVTDLVGKIESDIHTTNPGSTFVVDPQYITTVNQTGQTRACSARVTITHLGLNQYTQPMMAAYVLKKKIDAYVLANHGGIPLTPQETAQAATTFPPATQAEIDAASLEGVQPFFMNYTVLMADDGVHFYVNVFNPPSS
jgi:hypothetical protein